MAKGRYDLVLTGNPIDEVRLEIINHISDLKNEKSDTLGIKWFRGDRAWGMIDILLRAQIISYNEWKTYFNIINKLHDKYR